MDGKQFEQHKQFEQECCDNEGDTVTLTLFTTGSWQLQCIRNPTLMPEARCLGSCNLIVLISMVCANTIPAHAQTRAEDHSKPRNQLSQAEPVPDASRTRAGREPAGHLLEY